MFYRCPGCNFNIHISCLKLDMELPEEEMLKHPNHPHPLTLTRKPASVFYCDGCGTEDRDTEDRDMAYTCTTCDIWIHKTCASLPIILTTNLHHHQLSLAPRFPIQHRNFSYDCALCNKYFNMRRWVYYCGDCRYFVHVKCAASEANKEIKLNEEEKNDSSDLIQLPVHDISKELIAPFIIRENGLDRMPNVNDMPSSVNMPETTASFSILFNYHKHPLGLVSEAPADDELMICDVCVAPIYSPPYYNCAACKYFVHSTCHFLPRTLSSCPDSQLYGNCPQTHENHKLTAYSSSELDDKGLLICDLCEIYTNGMVYECKDCKLRMDVKCASLPTIIKHASHSHHKLIKTRIPHQDLSRRQCYGCKFWIQDYCRVAYYCTSDGCDFKLHLGCAMLPQSVKHERDKHLLLLTYDASIDHPADFYCDFCEVKMHPKEWMYHCRECDHSVHPDCLTGSGGFRNVKFGRQFEFDHSLHPHPLTYNPITLKKRCDTCHEEWSWYDRYDGFECASCNYAVCYDCGLEKLDKM